MHPRYLKEKILKNLKASPITLLTGGRQTGKTTLVKQLAEELGYLYLTFDNLRLLASARKDPVGFLDQYSSPLVIDEIQRVPELALPLKLKVDENRTAGMYLLTGSSNPLVAPKLNDSLAGRLFISHLYPLSQAEIRGTQPALLSQLFDPSYLFPAKYPTCHRDELLSLILQGGYPTVLTLDEEMRDEWFDNHLKTLLERDIADLAQIKKIQELPYLLELLANRSGNLLNTSELSRSIKIPYSTLTFYLILIEALFLVTKQPPWHRNKTKQLTKSPKIYMEDTGMMSFLIGANKKRILSHPSLFGHLFETFVLSEFRKLMSWNPFHLKALHYRTASGIEVDLLLENRAKEVVAIEIKSHETLHSKDFKNLSYLQKELKEDLIRGVVLYPGSDVVSFGPNLIAIPISSLWN